MWGELAKDSEAQVHQAHWAGGPHNAVFVVWGIDAAGAAAKKNGPKVQAVSGA